MSSLQDQLLKAGLVDQKQVKRVNKDKRKQEKVQRKSREKHVDEAKVQAQQAKSEKVERDRELNRQRRAEAENKAIAAQIKQLIETNRQSRGEGDTPYNFTDGKVIKKILVSDPVGQQLARGQLAIVKLGERYELVPRVVAEKIRERDESYIVLCHQPQSGSDEADPYADYQIPDDLMW